LKTDPTFDRRKYLRVRTEQLVAIGRLDAREGLAHALDMSMGGIRFQCVGMDAKEGEMLKVTLTLGERTTSVVGQIARTHALDEFTQEVAISFVKMDDETRRYLEEHLPFPEDASWSDERRAYSRVMIESVVSVARANLIDVVAQAQDLSMGGIRFVIDGMDLELGDVLRVTVELDGRVVTAVGQLVRATELDEYRQEVAMAFLEVEPTSLALMRDSLPPEDAEID
jgi:hypothetical protein